MFRRFTQNPRGKAATLGLLALCFGTTWSAQSGHTDLAALMACTFPAGDGHWQLQTSLVQPDEQGGQTTLEGVLDVQRRGNNHSARFRISAPADMAGGSYFFHKDAEALAMYMYLPAMGQVRRLAPGSQIELLGTSLPLQPFFGLFDANSHTAAAAGKRLQQQGQNIQKVHLNRFGSDAQTIESATAWIDTDHCQLRRWLDESSRDAQMIEFHYPSTQARWPEKMTVQPLGDGAESRIFLRPPTTPIDARTLSADNFFRHD